MTLIPATAPDFFIADTPTAVLVRQVLGAIAQFDKASTVAKLKAARERKRLASGKCEGRKRDADYQSCDGEDRQGTAQAQTRQLAEGYCCRSGRPRLRQRQRQGVFSGIGAVDVGVTRYHRRFLENTYVEFYQTRKPNLPT